MSRKIAAGKKIFVLLIVMAMLFSIFALTGCGAQLRPAPTQPAPGPNITGTPQQPTSNTTQQSQMIAQKVSQLEGINSATVVLAEKSAWVGVDIRADSTQQMTNELKDKITEVVKAEDNTVEKVFVSADADTVTRLRNIARDIGAGRPVSGFINELYEIGRRITPSTR